MITEAPVRFRYSDVQSSNIRAVGWGDGTLFVAFHHGGVYRYSDVPESIYDSLRNAPSVGKYFNQEIKGRFHFDRLDEQDPQLHDLPLLASADEGVSAAGT